MWRWDRVSFLFLTERQWKLDTNITRAATVMMFLQGKQRHGLFFLAFKGGHDGKTCPSISVSAGNHNKGAFSDKSNTTGINVGFYVMKS